mgnify:CR=1 FL=1
MRLASTRQTASWTATLRAPGRYAVWVRIPVKHATTRSAVYRISTVDGTRTRTINQRYRAGTWALLIGSGLGSTTLTGTGQSLPFTLGFSHDQLPADLSAQLRVRVSLSGQLTQRLPGKPIATLHSQNLGALQLVSAP